MKKRVILFIIGLLLMAGISILYFYQQKYNAEERTSTYHLTKEEKELIQEGDIILRHGFGLISDAIVKYAQDMYPVSHCGIIVKDSLGDFFVIHTVSNTLVDIDGMQQDGFDKFVKESHKNSLIIVRYHYENDTEATAIANCAKHYLSQQIPFDNKFDSNDSTAFFCTELIRNVFIKALNVDLYTLSPAAKIDCMSFSPFFQPAYFSFILNHCEE